MNLRNLMPSWLVRVKPGPEAHFMMSGQMLAHHYEQEAERLRLVQLPKGVGYVPPVHGHWPVIERVKQIKSPEDHDVVSIKIIGDGRMTSHELIFYLAPQELVTVATEERP